MWMLDGKHISLFAPQERAKSVSCFHFVKWGILGIRMVYGFGPDWVDGRSIACLEWVCKRGFAQESLGEPSNFQVVASGHNINGYTDNKAFIHKSFGLLTHNPSWVPTVVLVFKHEGCALVMRLDFLSFLYSWGRPWNQIQVGEP